MANVLVEETSLSNIASAIREKSGGSATYKPGEMAAAISNLSTYVPTDEDLTFKDCQSTKLFAGNQFSWLLDNYKDKKIRFTGNCYYMADTFYASKREDLSNFNENPEVHIFSRIRENVFAEVWGKYKDAEKIIKELEKTIVE